MHDDYHMTLNMFIGEVRGGNLALEKYIGPIQAASQCKISKDFAASIYSTIENQVPHWAAGSVGWRLGRTSFLNSNWKGRIQSYRPFPILPISDADGDYSRDTRNHQKIWWPDSG